MTTASVKRKAPRKAAVKVNGNGHANGHPLPAAEEFVPVEKPVKVAAAPKPAHPYGSKQTYTFNPADGSDPIIFPSISEVDADAHFFWKIYQMNEMFQAFEWMNKAGVPLFIQERVMLLSDLEKQSFFAGWFAGVVTPQGVTPPGES